MAFLPDSIQNKISFAAQHLSTISVSFPLLLFKSFLFIHYFLDLLLLLCFQVELDHYHICINHFNCDQCMCCTKILQVAINLNFLMSSSSIFLKKKNLLDEVKVLQINRNYNFSIFLSEKYFHIVLYIVSLLH